MQTIGKQVSATVVDNVFREIEARAKTHRGGRAAVVRDILNDWYEMLPEGARVYRSNGEMVE